MNGICRVKRRRIRLRRTATALIASAVGVAAAPALAQAMVFHTAFGQASSGAGSPANPDGQFSQPRGLGVDAAGTVYVADGNNQRVQSFSRAGAFLGKWAVTTTGGGGGNPLDVATDGTHVWVMEQSGGTLRRYGTGGVLAAQGTVDITVGSSAAGVALDAAGNLVHSSYGLSHLRRYDRTGDAWALGATWGSAGTGAGQLARPLGVATSPDGATVYVAERDANRVQRFTSAGVAQGAIGSAGSGAGGLNAPTGVAVDPRDGSVWVADAGNNRVQRFSAAGAHRETLAVTGGPGVQTFRPEDVAVDGEGFLYVLDAANSRVIVFEDRPAPPPNRAPLTGADTLVTAEDTPAVVDVLANDGDPDGEPLTVTGATDGSRGTVSCTATGACTYTPGRDLFGADSFTYAVADPRGGTATGTVRVTVTPVDDPPPPAPPAAPRPPAGIPPTAPPSSARVVPVANMAAAPLVVGAPQTVSVAGASVQAPAAVSLAALHTARCVDVRVTATRPLRLLVTIYSGRRSLRLFGAREARFTAPGTKVVCVPVPRRARTFRPRDGLTLDIRSAGLSRVGFAVAGVKSRRVPIRVAP